MPDRYCSAYVGIMTVSDSPSSSSLTSTTPAAPRRPRWRRILRVILVALAVLVLLLAGLTLWGVHSLGPRFGIYLMPPSEKRYAVIVAEHLDRGIYAQGPEWEKARADLIAAGETADSYADLYAPIEKAAEVAGGKHTFFQTPAEVQEMNAQSTADFAAPTVTTDAGITTVTLPELGPVSEDKQEEYARTAADLIDRAAPDTCAWIIDLRGNRGGNMWPMLSGVSALLPEGTAMSFRAGDGSTTDVQILGDGAGMNDHTITSVGPRERITERPIAVLQDEDTASSGEAVATSFLGLNAVDGYSSTSFGTETAGYTSGNETIRLYDDAELTFTSTTYADRTGRDLQEKPITPDHATAADQADEAAVEHLISSPGCGG